MKYLVEGKAIRDSNGRLTTPSGIPIPPGVRGQPLQTRLDAWLATNPKSKPTPVNPVTTVTSLIEASSAPVHFFEAEITPRSPVESLNLEMGHDTEDELASLVESWTNEAKKVLKG